VKEHLKAVSGLKLEELYKDSADSLLKQSVQDVSDIYQKREIASWNEDIAQTCQHIANLLDQPVLIRDCSDMIPKLGPENQAIVQIKETMELDATSLMPGRVYFVKGDPQFSPTPDEIHEVILTSANLDFLYRKMEDVESRQKYGRLVRGARHEVRNSINQLLAVLQSLTLSDQKLENFLNLDAGELIDVAKNCIARHGDLLKAPRRYWNKALPARPENAGISDTVLGRIFRKLVDLTCLDGQEYDRELRSQHVGLLYEQILMDQGIFKILDLVPVVLIDEAERTDPDIPEISYISTKLESNLKRCIRDRRPIAVRDILTEKSLWTVLKIIDDNLDLDDFGGFKLFAKISAVVGAPNLSFVYDQRTAAQKIAAPPTEELISRRKFGTVEMLEGLIEALDRHNLKRQGFAGQYAVVSNTGEIELKTRGKNDCDRPDLDFELNLSFLRLQLYRERLKPKTVGDIMRSADELIIEHVNFR